MNRLTLLTTALQPAMITLMTGKRATKKKGVVISSLCCNGTVSLDRLVVQGMTSLILLLIINKNKN